MKTPGGYRNPARRGGGARGPPPPPVSPRPPRAPLSATTAEHPNNSGLQKTKPPPERGEKPPYETIQHDDGRVELKEEALREIEASPLYNEDLAPVPVAKRNWTTYNYAALWISMAHCIPTYMMASGLISAGMNWWQALITILLGNTIVLAPILLNSHPGTKYGIPFPVFARAAYGTVGSNLPALMRAIVACGWFGIQAWIGGQALQTFFAAFHSGLGDAARRARSAATRRPNGFRSCCFGA